MCDAVSLCSSNDIGERPWLVNQYVLKLTYVNGISFVCIVLIVTVVAFTFMGIEGIADEIEMPFGTKSFFLM